MKSERAELLRRQLDIEVTAELLIDMSNDPKFPSHMRSNFGDVARRLQQEAQYLQQARRELR